MINCPNCQKRIPTIPDKDQNITCPCKVTLSIRNEELHSYHFYITWKEKKLQLSFFFNIEDKSKDFHVFQDGQSILHMSLHPPLSPTNFEKLKTYLVFS